MPLGPGLPAERAPRLLAVRAAFGKAVEEVLEWAIGDVKRAFETGLIGEAGVDGGDVQWDVFRRLVHGEWEIS